MALRPFITAGVAFATAGVVAATVAIAPPMSPGDLKVAKSTEVTLNALVSDPALVPLINTYFGRPPSGVVTGATGVVQQLLLGANAADPIAQALINAYITGGSTELAQLFLTAFNPDPSAREQINTYFDGGLSELARLRLLWSTNDPTQRAWINRYFGEFVNDDGSQNISQDGTQGVIWRFLADRGLSPQQRAILDTFWNAPTPYNSQAVPVLLQEVGEDGKPVVDEDGDPVYVPVKDTAGNVVVDENGDPVYVVDYYLGNSNPARQGAFGVLYNQIAGTGLNQDQQDTLDQFWDGGVTEVVKQRLLASTADPTQRFDIETFFDGGITENIRWRLLANGDANSRNLTNEFFDNGITGVIRYLLVGPVRPPTPAPVPPANVRVANVEESTDVKTQESTDTDSTDKVSTGKVTAEKVTTLAGKSDTGVATSPVAKPAPAEEAAAEPEAAPATGPEAAPAPAPKSTSKVKEKAAAEDAEVKGTKGGNKFEPEIIVPSGGGGKSGSGSWGVFGDIAQAVVKHVTGGGAPAKKPATGGADSGNAGGDSDGDGGGE